MAIVKSNGTSEISIASAKDEMTKIIQAQPDDSSYEELLRELAFSRMVERGLQDSLSGRTISDDEMRQRINLRYL